MVQMYDAPLRSKYDEDILEIILDEKYVPSVHVMRGLIKTRKDRTIGAQKVADSYEALRRIGILAYSAGQQLVINPKYVQVNKVAIWEKETQIAELPRSNAQFM